MSEMMAMPKADNVAKTEREPWIVKMEARDKARREKYKLITQHPKPRCVTAVLGGEDFAFSRRARFDCMAVVRGAGWAAVCVRTRYGDAAISRMQTGEQCYSLRSVIAAHTSRGAWIGHDEIWLSRDAWGPKSEDWHDAADFVCGENRQSGEDDEDAYSAQSTPVHIVGLDIIEQSFDQPIARIADAAREGRLGRIQCLHQLDHASKAGQREDLSNLEAFGLAMCVYAQAGDE